VRPHRDGRPADGGSSNLIVALAARTNCRDLRSPLRRHDGGLVFLWGYFVDQYPARGGYVDRILKG